MKNSQKIATAIAKKKRIMEMEKKCLDLTVKKGGLNISYYNNRRQTKYRTELELRSIFKR